MLISYVYKKAKGHLPQQQTRDYYFHCSKKLQRIIKKYEYVASFDQLITPPPRPQKKGVHSPYEAPNILLLRQLLRSNEYVYS